jgi:Helix-turn-helix domain of resolvase
MAKGYDTEKMRNQLAQLKQKLQGTQITQIAAQEQCSVQTVYNYLNGKGIHVPALARAIINMGNDLTKE